MEKVNNLKEVGASHDDLLRDLTEKSKRIDDLNNKNTALIEKLNEKNQEFFQLQSEYRNTSEHLNNIYQDYENANLKISEKEKEIESLTLEKEKEIKSLRNENDNFTQQVQYYTDVISNLTNTEKIKKKELRNSLLVGCVPLVSLMVLVIFSYYNPGIYSIQEETVYLISQGVNAALLLIIPFVCGTLAALTRVLISELPVIKNTFLIIASGLMSVFSWVGVKSGIIATLLEQRSEVPQINVPLTVDSPESFYKMILIAIIVGMFSSSIFVYVQEKVERITNNQSDRRDY
ncbi:hypothetical protein JHL08_02740 [Vibrio campbellii]|uniref:hypothetical protein n=1 Tax=Vibrio campbellii TaxID=680 RepID=UPI003989FB07